MGYDIKKIKAVLFEDHEIKSFCIRNHLTDEDIINNLNQLFLQKDYNLKPKKCTSSYCMVDPSGYHTKLDYSNGKVTLLHYRCPAYQDLGLGEIDMMFFPNKDEFRKQEVDVIPQRAPAFKAMMKFKSEYQRGSFTKGIYFHGSFGTGKTFLMYRLALDMVSLGEKVLFAYYPDLVRYIKSSIGSPDFEKIIVKLKNIDILMLDDIGAEANSNFIRDEVLGPILQYRLVANLPICMTSNLNFSLLKEHFMESRDEINVINSDRIIERMRFLMNEVQLTNKNYRLQ